MKRLKLQIIVAIALTIGAVIAFSVNVHANGLQIAGQFAPASIGPAKSGVIYFTIVNGTDVPDRLLAVSCDAADKAELHTTRNEDGVMKMRSLEAIDVGAGGSHELKQGSDHVMLFGLKAPLKEGDTIKMVLTFETAGNVTVEVPVQKAMHGMMHNMDGSMNHESGTGMDHNMDTGTSQ